MRDTDPVVETILTVARELAGTLNRSEILDRVQRRVAEALRCEIVFTFYWDPGYRGFRIVAQHGVPEEFEDALDSITFQQHEPFAGRVSAGESIIVSSFNEWPSLPRPLLDAAGVRSLMVAPLNVGGTNIGRLVAVSTERRFEDGDRPVFNAIALQLALALETADLYRAKEEEAANHLALSTLGRELLAASDFLSVVDTLNRWTVRLLQCDRAVLFVSDDEEHDLVAAAECGADDSDLPLYEKVPLPAAAFGRLAREILDHGVIHVADTGAASDAISRRASSHGYSRATYIGLTRSDTLIGIQAALYRSRSVFGTPPARLTSGISQLGAFAVAGARLLHQLEDANRVKADFVATMSHELRSPLNVILGYTDLLLEGAFGDLGDDQTDTLQRIQARGWELLELINTTLDLSRFAAGHIRVDAKTVDVAEMLAEIEAEAREANDNDLVDILVAYADEPVTIETDGPKLKVVLRNLVRNALKFTERGSVRLAVCREGTRLRFDVVDTGIGIPPEARDAVFEAFRQVDSSMTRRHGGAGLGLYIVRQLLDLLGGEIRLKSAVGKGTTFHVWVPERQDDVPGTAEADRLG